MITGEGTAKMGLASAEEVASDMEARKRQSLLEPEALSQAHLPIREEEEGYPIPIRNSPYIRGVAMWDAKL